MDRGYNIMNVYILYKDDKTPFYVGAGNDRRIDNHLCGSGGRSSVNEIIAEHRNRGSDISYDIVGKYDTKDEAFAAEVMLISMIGKISDGGTLVNVTDGGEGVSGYKATPENNLKNSKRNLERFSDPLEREKTSKTTREAMLNPDIRAKISKKLKDKWQDIEYVRKQRESHTGIKDSDMTKENKSKSCSKSWSEGKRKGKYTDDQVNVIYSMKGLSDAREVALIYGMNPTYVHKIWRHERCRMALIRLGIIEPTEGL